MGRLTGGINSCGGLARVWREGGVDGVGDADESGRAVDGDIETAHIR